MVDATEKEIEDIEKEKVDLVYPSKVFLFCLVCLIIGFVCGLMFASGSSDKIISSTCVSQKDLNNVLNQQTLIANYVGAEAQCLQSIQKCQMINDNNISFEMRCLK